MKNWQIGDDILDTRDVQARIEELEELEEELDEARQDYLDACEFEPNLSQEELDQLNEAYQDAIAHRETEELEALRDFRDELEGYCDWDCGEGLIHERYRADYARELASDIGAVGDNSGWIKIDWEATADELFRFDYTSADLQGHTYYVRMS